MHHLMYVLLLGVHTFYTERGVYVSVAVGHSKKRTKTVKGDGLPYWNEEFAL